MRLAQQGASTAYPQPQTQRSGVAHQLPIHIPNPIKPYGGSQNVNLPANTQAMVDQFMAVSGAKAAYDELYGILEASPFHYILHWSSGAYEGNSDNPSTLTLSVVKVLDPNKQIKQTNHMQTLQAKVASDVRDKAKVTQQLTAVTTAYHGGLRALVEQPPSFQYEWIPFQNPINYTGQSLPAEANQKFEAVRRRFEPTDWEARLDKLKQRLGWN